MHSDSIPKATNKVGDLRETSKVKSSEMSKPIWELETYQASPSIRNSPPTFRDTVVGWSI